VGTGAGVPVHKARRKAHFWGPKRLEYIAKETETEEQCEKDKSLAKSSNCSGTTNWDCMTSLANERSYQKYSDDNVFVYTRRKDKRRGNQLNTNNS